MPRSLCDSQGMFLVVHHRSGAEWRQGRPLEEQPDWEAHAAFMDSLVESGFVVLGGPLADEHRVALVVDAPSEEEVRATFAQDPWHGRLLEIASVDAWTIRLDGR